MFSTVPNPQFTTISSNSFGSFQPTVQTVTMPATVQIPIPQNLQMGMTPNVQMGMTPSVQMSVPQNVHMAIPSSSYSNDPNVLRRNWYKNPSQLNANTMNSFTMDSRNSVINPSQINAINAMSVMNNSAMTMSKQSSYGSSSSTQPLTNKQTGTIEHEKPVKIIDQKSNKPIDTVPNQLKLPVTDEEYENAEDKELWAEQQRYLGFSKQKFQAILGVHLGFLILSIAALIVCVVLFVVDPATDYEWKLFGIIASGGLALCLFFGIIFLLLYAKWKHERCKEELENETANKDANGNDIKRAGLTKIYKYSKPNQKGDSGPAYMATQYDPTPPPTIINPPQILQSQMLQQPMPVQVPMSVQQYALSSGQPMEVIKQPIKTVIVKEPPRQIITVRRGSTHFTDDEEITDLETQHQGKNAKIVVVKPRKKSLIFKNVLKKVKAPSRGINIIPVSSEMIMDEPTKLREIRSPSHIPVIEIEPHETEEAPRVIKISRNEMVASRTPISSSSRTQLLQSSNEKKPVILNKNIGEDLNAFRDS